MSQKDILEQIIFCNTWKYCKRKFSNLCTEIVEYTAPDEAAVCNLASISLSKLVTPTTDYTQGSFDFDKLKEIAMVVTKNLNRIIDRNFYPIEEARR